ncbi:A-kinase anchor protein 9 [Lampris incognitus]|uniref:A-kinase anchor protein 9 n=1 Tax=Lampris incognitus TaxID=2546036 RepID=UPI0024B57853|nr:A-kinase anchor protein 9 [Lampris incognitus]
MEDEERQKKLEAGKAKLAEYRQRKAHADSQKKQKKKKKKRHAEDLEGDPHGNQEVGQDESTVGDEVTAGGRGGVEEEEDRHPPTTEFTFARTLRSGETVKHDQTYTIEPESEVSTTAEDYSSEVNGCHEMTGNLMKSSKDFVWEDAEVLQQVAKEGRMQDIEDALAAKTLAVEELSRELEELRSAFGTEGVQQLQDFEAALKQRDGIITQLTANLQQARKEKDEIMREFLEMTEQSQKLHIQFQQLQAGETLRNTSHSSTAADLLQARQQLVQCQQQLEDLSSQVKGYQERSNEQLLQISQLQHKFNEMEMAGRKSEESFAQRFNEKDRLIAQQERVMLEQEQSLKVVTAKLSLVGREVQDSVAQTLQEKDLLISEQIAIITEHEHSLTLLREELSQVGRTTQEIVGQKLDEKDLIIAEQERVISERDCCLTQLEDELESSKKHLNDLHQRMTSKELELERCLDEMESTKGDLESCKGELISCRLDLEKGQIELESCKSELMTSRQKERMSSNEIMQLMGTVEDLQKRCHQGSMSEMDTLQRIERESLQKLEVLRAELDEMYGQQIVQMKQELNFQHAAQVEQLLEQHRAELQLVRSQEAPQSLSVTTSLVNDLNATVMELQERLQESQAMQDKAINELSQVAQEKLNLQAQVEDLLKDLHSAKDKVEKASQRLVSQESQQGELHRLQDTVDNLRSQLATAEEAAQEAETKHESETTNYKIKLEMLEREKDAVLDRMAESQEAELERLRTQLLFSHEEELTHLREDLQRESYLNTENLLNEASVKHDRALEELRICYEDQLQLLGREKAGFVTERDELLHQILSLKEDLKLSLHSSKADELVQQLQELQVEVEELRKGGAERARMEKEFQALLMKTEKLENQSKDKEESWKNKLMEQVTKQEVLIESNNTLKRELEAKHKDMESLMEENNQIQQQMVQLREELEKQQTTFSFAEKNFDVNYQELKEEYTCLTEAKTQLEAKTLKETLELEAKIASLQLQIQELQDGRKVIKLEDEYKDSSGFIEKDTTELMEKLSVAMSENESLSVQLSEVTEQLIFTKERLGQLEGELMSVRQENKAVMAQNNSLEKELEGEREIIREQARLHNAESKAKLQQGETTAQPVASVCSIEDHHIQILSLQGEVETLQSLLQTTEAERDSIRHALEVQRLLQTPSPAAVQFSGEGPVEGRSSPQKSTASGSSRRKRRQRSKQERKSNTVLPDKREERQRQEEEEPSVEEERAASAAEHGEQVSMESQVTLHSQQRASKEDSTDGYQRDRDHINKRVKRGHGAERHVELEVQLEAAAHGETAEHGECRLQLAAQRISLSQIHAAQLELLQEQTDTHTCSLELEHMKEKQDRDDAKTFKYQNVIQALSEECNQLILSFANIFGDEFLGFIHQTDAEGWSTPPVEKEESRDSPSVLLEARELYRDLQLVKERIEQELGRLTQLQTVLKADGNKMMELQKAYDELKDSSEKEIASLRRQAAGSSPFICKDPEEQAGTAFTSYSEDLERLRAEVQEKQIRLEERHKQEMEHLRTYYQQQAAETEERYTTELIILEQRLQEVTSTQTQFSVAPASYEIMEEHTEELKQPGEEEASEVEADVEPRCSSRSTGLTAQLQTLKRALYHKYFQEVAALKEQHSSELRRLREEREQERSEGKARADGREENAGVAEAESDLEGIRRAGCSIQHPRGGGSAVQEEKLYWERMEQEVAKVIVQMSVDFAQQTELARISKHSCQTTSAMQTQPEEEEGEEEEETERENEEPSPRVFPGDVSSLEEVERKCLERQLKEMTAEVQRLKEQLRKAELGPEQAINKGEEKDRGVGHPEDQEGPHKMAEGSNISSHDGLDSTSVDVITTERNLLRKANERIRQVLVDVLKTTVAAEETMGLHMESLREASSAGLHPAPPRATTQRATWQRVSSEPFRPYTTGPSSESWHGSETGTDDGSMWSRDPETDEGLEVSQQMVDSVLLGVETQLENEEYLMSISTRLQMALERMLVTITETSNQLEHARVTQTELMRESFRHNQEIGELLQKQEELQERLAEEARAREQLALELHRAEGLIDGYTGERAALEEQVRQKEELQLSLEQELQVTSSRLHELEQERLQMQEERELLSRQQDAMREHAGPRELHLLEETEKLMKEKVEVQRQAEKENMDLLKQVKLLEAELEEQVSRVIELEQTRKAESGDLQQQVQALEKQLEKNRRFLDEQAVDREHERDFFQQEIQKLEQQLKNPPKPTAGSEQRNREVDQLTSQLKEKADWCSELLLGTEQLQRELGERDEEIDKLESRVRELEQALLASTESPEKVEHRKQHASISEGTCSILEAQLQTEREALDRKEKEISNLEEQLEQFREELENKSEEVQQLHMQLEIQRKELSSQQQYMETRDSMLQVMEEKDREIELLNENITKLQHMETATDNKEMDQRDELIRELESQVECLRSEQERLKRKNEEELDQLNAVIDTLQQELVNTERNQASEEEEDCKDQPESDDSRPSKEEYDEMKQKVDLATKELVSLKAEHGKLLETYRRLKENAVALAETEKLESSDVELEDALREKTAGLVVMQAQVQALEQSATCKVEELDRRIQELEDLVDEKDTELASCRILVEQAQNDAGSLQQKVFSLEDKLREKVASALVGKVQLEAFQQQLQSSEDHKAKEQDKDSSRQTEAQVYDFGDLGIPKMDFCGMAQTRKGPTGKVIHLTEKLRELEVGLSGMQKDQELQKQLLSSSEEEVLEYERRLIVLMDLLNQMKTKSGPQQRTTYVESSPAGDQTSVSELQLELQEVRNEVSATKEQLSIYKESLSGLQEELKEKGLTIDTLRGQLEMASEQIHKEANVSELQQELSEVQNEAAATKEELSSCRESCHKLQELLQEREMTIAQLKGELFRITSEEEGTSVPEILQELQEVKNEASATKEELHGYRERTEKLQEDLQARDLAIAKLREELHEVGAALIQATAAASPSPSPSPQPPSSYSSTTQPKRKGEKKTASKGSSGKDKPSLPRKNSASTSQSCDKPWSPPLSSDSQQQRVAMKDSATQTEALQTSDHSLGGTSMSAEAKEQMEEVIGEFQEKIVQMQELHAAEILDMEARHISESETLRRDTQALEEECKALKTLIDKLRSTEPPSARLDRPTPAQFKDGYTSDSSSDYSQRTGYDLPNLQPEYRTTPEGARREGDDPLPDRIKSLLREVHQEGMQVLSLSELPLAEGELGSQLYAQGWVKEREALLATVESLKGLITQMQTHRETQTSGSADWRRELLAAVQQVFARERGVLKSTLYSQLDLLDTSDTIVHLNQLERRLAEQDAKHKEAMGSLQTADRSSLLSEIHHLRGQLEQLHRGLQPAAASVGEISVEQERGTAGVHASSGAEEQRLLVEELKGELAQTKLELETTLKAQHKHLRELDTLRAEVSQKASELDTLSDHLSAERKRSRDLQWAMEKEKCKTGRSQESKQEELEDLQLTLAEQQSRVAQLTSALEQEHQTSTQLTQQADQERISLHRRLQELQVQLETERAKAQEMSSVLGRERELRTGISSEGGPSQKDGAEEDEGKLEKEGGILERLQRELDEKHAQVVQLLGEVEAQKLEAVRREEELTLAGQRSGIDQEALQEARAQLSFLEAQMSEVQLQVEREVEGRRLLEEEKERLEERVAQLREMRTEKVADSGPPLADGKSQSLGHSESTDRTKDWVFQQKGSTPLLQEVTRMGQTGGPHQGPWRTIDKILGKLHLIASKVRKMASKATSRLTTEVDSEELSWIQSNIDEVITMLQQSPGLPATPENVALSAGGTCNSLTERLLRQNAELTGFVSRLTEEKNDLRNQTLRLEEELRRYRQAGLGLGDSSGSRRGATKMDSAGLLLSQEREAWARERLRLEKALHLTQAQVARLRGEIRTDVLREASGPEADNAALKRMYGKYLRSESFRKALIYQKKYLLLLLGGFQECEEATLSLISRMGGRPSLSSLDSLSQRRRGLMRFRSAVRVSIALSRMRFLVKRWQKATGMNSVTLGSVNKNGVGQTTGTEARDSPYLLHPGSVEVYRERGGGVCSSRGRSGRDSPRSAVSSTPHRFHMTGDASSLTCSHLQNYDPDRALTDYISRLEALQRRLGSVTSGSSSYAQLHFGLRR